MSRIIEKKTWTRFFDLMWKGEKMFDIRLQNFKVEPGDKILFREWDPEAEKYTGRELELPVKHVWMVDFTDFNDIEDIQAFGHQIIVLNMEGEA